MLDLGSFSAFIFDLDGTLLDSEKYHVRAFAQAVLELGGHELSPEEEYEFMGHTSLGFAGVLAQRHGLDIVPEEVAALKFERLYDVYVAELFPGVEVFLDAWFGRVPMALASNSPRHFVERAVGDLELDRFFELILTRDDVTEPKPAPEMLRRALAALGSRAGETLVFEDSSFGIQSAQAAGCPLVVLHNEPYELPPSIPEGVPVVTWERLIRDSGWGGG